MRWAPIGFAATLLASFAVAAVEPATGQEGQPVSPSASQSAAPVPAVATDSVQAPAAAVVPAEAAPATAAAGVAVPAETAPAEAAGSQPTTLMLATVAPPADFRPPAGYRAVKSGLETVYCTTYTPIGSRMSQKVCMSRQQVEEMLRQQDEARRQLAKGGGCTAACGGP